MTQKYNFLLNYQIKYKTFYQYFHQLHNQQAQHHFNWYCLSPLQFFLNETHLEKD